MQRVDGATATPLQRYHDLQVAMTMSTEENDAMAGSRTLLVVHDASEGHLVYDLRLEDEQALQLRPFPRPAVPPLHYRPLAVTGGGDILGVTQPDPQLRKSVLARIAQFPDRPSFCIGGGSGLSQVWDRNGFQDPGVRDTGVPVMLPVGGDGLVVRMDTVMHGEAGCFEALRPVPGPGGGWRATPLPRPLVGDLFPFERAPITAYFAMGARVWVSVARKGTFSLDTSEPGAAWLMETPEELPFLGRGVVVPELGGLLFALARPFPASAEPHQFLCSYEFFYGKPSWRRLWREAVPWECVDAAGHEPSTETASLAYLGKGRFCICRPVDVLDRTPSVPVRYTVCSLLVLELRRRSPDGEVELAKRGRLSCHGMWMEGQCLDLYLIQSSAA